MQQQSTMPSNLVNHGSSTIVGYNCSTSASIPSLESQHRCHDIWKKFHDLKTRTAVKNPNDSPRCKPLDKSTTSGQCNDQHRYTIILVLVFVFTFLVMQWRLWPEYNANLIKNITGQLNPVTIPHISVTNFILDELRRNGTTPCHKVLTNFTRIFNLSHQSYKMDDTALRFSTNFLHTILMDSYAEDGTLRCAGGDYYEADMHNDKWHSRPKVQDFWNGSYGISFFVDSLSEGLFNFSVTLLFGNFHGMEYMTRAWDVRAQMLFFQVEFFNIDKNMQSHSYELLLPSNLKMRKHVEKHNNRDIQVSKKLNKCNVAYENFQQKEWDGRWTREWVNNSCKPDKDGRFVQCVSNEQEKYNNSSHTSTHRWSGRVSRLESNGWVYSLAHCGFHIYEAQEAWDCLSGRWLLFWGDSNFQDTIRNLMLFVLNIPIPYWSTLSTFQLPRNLEEYFINPRRPDQALHVSLIFNGHFIVWDGNLGLDSLRDSTYRDSIVRHFNGSMGLPDTIIMNSGLHDGMHFNSVENYSESVDRALAFWKELLDSLPPAKRGGVVYRSTVAPAGESRGMQSNPQKMEVFNKIMVERLLSSMPSALIVDAFDMTFPFHYDNNYSDGGHYGRAPNANLKPWFGQPHQYFVDLMLVHVLLNSICPSPN